MLKNTDLRVQVDTEENADSFPNADLEGLLRYFHTVLGGIIEDESCILTGSQDRKGIYIQVEFEDKAKNNGLLIGAKFRVVTSLLELLRFQQVYPHNRFIEIRVVKPDGSIQSIKNKRTFKRNETEIERVANLTQWHIEASHPNDQLAALRKVGKQVLDAIDRLEPQVAEAKAREESELVLAEAPYPVSVVVETAPTSSGVEVIDRRRSLRSTKI